MDVFKSIVVGSDSEFNGIKISFDLFVVTLEMMDPVFCVRNACTVIVSDLELCDLAYVFLADPAVFPVAAAVRGRSEHRVVGGGASAAH